MKQTTYNVIRTTLIKSLVSWYVYERLEDEYIDREPITEDVEGEPIAEDVDGGPLGDDLDIDGRAVNDGINRCLLKPFSS